MYIGGLESKSTAIHLALDGGVDQARKFV